MLREQAQQLQQQIANLYLEFPELVDDDEVLRIDTLEGATNLHELLTAIHRACEDAKALRDGTKIRLEELKARKGRFAMRIDFLRAMMQKILEHAKVKKIELPECTLSIRNGAQQVLGEDASALPDELCRIVREPDKIKIKEKLLAGEAVPGFVLSNAAPTLAVHVK
jgi:hypothetical protein